MKRSSFTLIEMLVVLVITGILMGLAIPAFERLTVGSGVDAAARMVGAQLRLTRQYAITSRTRVALLMPQIDETTPAAIARHHVMFRPCQVDSGRNWVAWIPNTKWEVLPTGAVIAEADTDPGIAAPPNDGTFTQITGVPGFAAGSVIRAVAFKPNGSLVDAATYVSIVEGFPSGTNGLTVRNAKNLIDMSIDTYTGRVSYE